MHLSETTELKCLEQRIIVSRKNNKKNRNESQVFIDSYLFKFFTKTVIGFLIISVFLTLAQCTVKKPQSPQWSTNYVIPVINRIYTMEELISKIDAEALNIEGDGNVAFNTTEQLDTFNLNTEQLSTSGLSFDVSDSLGEVEIEPPSSDPVTVSLASVAGGLATSLAGDSLRIPSNLFNVVFNMPTISTFSSATIAEGGLLSIVNNNLGTQINNVIVQILDLSNNTTISTTSFSSSIPQGVIDTLVINLDGKTISSNIRMITWFETSAARIDSASTRNIQTQIEFSDIFTVSNAIAEVPQIIKNFSSTVELLETDIIESALLESGTIGLRITNGSTIPANLNISIPDLSKNNVALNFNEYLDPGIISYIEIDLSGYTLEPTDLALPQEIQINLITEISASAPDKYTIDKVDLFAFEGTISDLSFSEVQGVFSDAEISFDNSSFDIDIPTGFESVQFANVSLELNINNTVDLPGLLNIQLDGSNGKTLIISGNINPDGTTTILKNDSSVSDFIYPIPETIYVSGSASMGEDSYHGTIESNDFITGSVNLAAPMQVILNETKVETDIEKEEINQDDYEFVVGNVIEANFIYQVSSSIPLGANIEVFLSPDSTSLFNNPELKIGPLYITAAEVDSNGLATGVAVTEEQYITIDSADVDILKNSTLFIGQEIFIESSEGNMIKLNQDGFITLLGRIEVEYFFDGEI
ncbi:MAG: hypothetical protein DRP35_00560 [Candidatus Zixiibacteriota bacterium]|nr:MAG: hypothetical protein DRP35_00560 [candidate division Zixibacteria bacterium]